MQELLPLQRAEHDWPALIVDLSGAGPDIWINPVPEPKLAKLL